MGWQETTPAADGLANLMKPHAKLTANENFVTHNGAMAVETVAGSTNYAKLPR
jgi:hypothetical protein